MSLILHSLQAQARRSYKFSGVFWCMQKEVLAIILRPSWQADLSNDDLH
jgi:hypothetical protein